MMAVPVAVCVFLVLLSHSLPCNKNQREKRIGEIFWAFVSKGFIAWACVWRLCADFLRCSNFFFLFLSLVSQPTLLHHKHTSARVSVSANKQNHSKQSDTKKKQACGKKSKVSVYEREGVRNAHTKKAHIVVPGHSVLLLLVFML